MSKIVELGRHESSVGSVIERLDRHQKKIKNISCVISWDDGSITTAGDNKDISIWCLHEKCLGLMIEDVLLGSTEN